MTTNEMIRVLTGLERRIATLADKAHETCEQARHTFERLELLYRDVQRLRYGLVSTSDTTEHEPLRLESPSS